MTAFSRFGPALLVSMLALPSLVPAPAQAWSNHALATLPAIAAMPELSGREPVEVEGIDRFLAAQADALRATLDAHERWARAHLPGYPARPETLRFDPAGAGSPDELRRRFLAALRVAPDTRLDTHLQVLPGIPAGDRRALPGTEVTTLPDDRVVARTPFVRLQEGERVSPLEVLASASDEPDYGMEIGLWEDNGTAHGGAYGFGTQPFGNPALAFGSQSPFHMGFWHESRIVFAAAPFLKRGLPEYRIALWKALAQHAFRNGHDYWGWRFTGWALHYVQDLTQPYHVRVLPGLGTARLLWIDVLDLLGISAPKAHAVTLVSNRHLALENLQRNVLLAGLADAADPAARHDAKLLLEALAGSLGSAPDAAFGPEAPRERVARQAASAADGVDRTIAGSMPARFVRDPGYEFGIEGDEIDLRELLARERPDALRAMIAVLQPLMAEYGRHTRSFVRSVREAK